MKNREEQNKGEDPRGEHRACPRKSYYGRNRGNPKEQERYWGQKGPERAGPCPPYKGLCIEQSQ